MLVNTYLNFDGNCEEAFNFYEKLLGGRIVAMVRHGGTPMAAHVPLEQHNQITHARMFIGTQVLMGSDSPSQRHTAPQGFAVSISVDEPADAERIFAGLSEAGTVRMALQETFWARKFGMVTDRFGIPWMVNCESPPA